MHSLNRHEFGEKQMGRRTLVSNNLHLCTMFGNAQGVVLHSWTAAYVTQDKDLENLLRRVILL